MKHLLWVSSCLLFAPAVAMAERAVVLPPLSELALPPGERESLTQALEGALRALGVEPAQSGASEPCTELACVAAQITETGADHAVELKIWRAPAGGISGVSVSLVQRDGARYSEGGSVTRAQDLEQALREATRGAYERLRRGPGPWLELEGQPAGAAVTVDGLAAGALPRKVKVNGGLHRVVVTHPGYEPFDETVTVPRNPDALKRVAIALREHPAVDYADGPLEVQSTTSPWNYAIAGAAVATGILLAIGPSRSAIDDGSCGRIEEGLCTGVIDFDAGQGIQLTAAGLLFAGGVAFAIWAPLDVRVDATGAQAALHAKF